MEGRKDERKKGEMETGEEMGRNGGKQDKVNGEGGDGEDE